MSCCSGTVLNGNSANTEGGRLRRLLKGQGCPIAPQVPQGNPCFVCPIPQTIQPSYTPLESSRIYTKMIQCGAQSGQVTQSRVAELLAQSQTRRQFVTEDQRIATVIQETVTCATNPANPEARFSDFARIPDPFLCPPLPAPPAPPARSCPLTKNQKY